MDDEMGLIPGEAPDDDPEVLEGMKHLKDVREAEPEVPEDLSHLMPRQIKRPD